MSSNSADMPTGSARAPARRSWSLTTRLALLSALSSFVILAVVSIQMYSRLITQLQQENSRYLRDEAETLRELARFPGFQEILVNEMHIDPLGEEYLTHYVRLLEADGSKQVVIETPGMKDTLPPDLIPPPAARKKPGTEVTVRGRNGSSFVVMSVPLVIKEDHGKPMVLQVALDVTNVERISARYRSELALILVLGSLLCAASGLALARRGMRPLRELTDQAREITVARLDQRLAGHGWPRELDMLAGSLNGMLDRLQDSFKRLYGSVENLTHKLRTPVTILRGEAEVALARERTAAELREVLESSVEEYGRLSRLIDNIIFLSQVEVGKIKPAPTAISACAEIAQVMEFYAPLAEEKQVRLECTGDASLTADPTLFRRALSCLVSNALIFTPPEGSVVVSAIHHEGSPTEIRVTDTGCGIAEQDLPKIFDRFYRVYATRFLDPRGTGLGLPLVKTIMDLHNGTVEVSSRPGEGTTVVLKFPSA